MLEQAGFPVSGLLATHGDWDHLLGRLAFPERSLGCGESTVAAAGTTSSGAAQRELRAFDDEHYVERPSAAGARRLQPLPVPGQLSLGSEGAELELHPDRRAHRRRHRVLVCRGRRCSSAATTSRRSRSR